MQIVNSKLVGVPYVPSPNSRGTIVPKILVIHNTGGGTVKSAVNWFANPESKVSAHLVIGRDGSITQCVPFNQKANHAGLSSWKNFTQGNSINGCSIGIELVNAGMLGVEANGGLYDRLMHSIKIEASNAIKAVHKNGPNEEFFWEKYPETQMKVLRDVAKLICSSYQIREIVGHDDVAPRRKIDPGPAFPMHEFRHAILG